MFSKVYAIATHLKNLPRRNSHQKKLSKARQERNNRRLKAFLARKSESGNTAHNTSIPENNHDDKMSTITCTSTPDSTTEPVANGETAAIPGKKDTLETPEVPITVKEKNVPDQQHPKRYACEADGVTPSSPAKAGKGKSHRLRVPKVTLDQPQNTYIYEVEQREIFILVYADTLDPYKEILKDKDQEFYEAIKRSHDHRFDVRHKTNFFYTEEREKRVEKVAKSLKLKLTKLYK